MSISTHLIRVLTEVVILLTKRQELILRVIVDTFITTAKPVGSRAIAKMEGISFSAATVRNDMKDLEDLGLLEKTHTSSGRIPSEQGYRYYVDYLIGYDTGRADIHIMKDMIEGDILEFEHVVKTSAEVLSELTNYTSIVLGPEIFETRLNQIQFVTLSPQTAVAILITNTGHVEHRSFLVPEQINPQDLEKMVNILNEKLHGVPMFRLPNLLETEIYKLMHKYLDEAERAYQYLQAAFLKERPVNLYIGGKSNMLLQPEFSDVEKLRSFYQMMENEGEIASHLKSVANGLTISIGNENELKAIKDFTLITASYELAEEHMGTIALIGPTRMEYRKVITLLRALSVEMTEALYLWYKHNG